ncbi:L-threonylcarbamoyladenylate synthase [Halobacteriaceae archaeon SHR40]|uniref:L-threonylcarbamoyladenylate synthase n=1 Tax=Halovenus amylolytica TaxID=2500550 RepID=UPI000FE3B247
MPAVPSDDIDIERAARAIEAGELVVYPTETVYGLGADALDIEAVESVFEAKGRGRSDPLSMAVADLATVREYTRPTERERAFIEAFLPGPVTVVLERKPMVPDVLTAGSERVGIRVPDHEVALELARQAGPITATSANVSGTGSARSVEELDEAIQDATAVVLDSGETPGGGSTVVDLENDEIHRRGARADEIDAWLSEH